MAVDVFLNMPEYGDRGNISVEREVKGNRLNGIIVTFNKEIYSVLDYKVDDVRELVNQEAGIMVDLAALANGKVVLDVNHLTANTRGVEKSIRYVLDGLVKIE